jgi:hypothetical protein
VICTVNPLHDQSASGVLPRLVNSLLSLLKSGAAAVFINRFE